MAAAEPLGGRFRLGRLIARSSTSWVHEASDLRTQQTVVVKQLIVPPDLAPNAAAIWFAHTRREADAAQRLHHPDIVALVAADIDARPPWLAMERVQAQDLTVHLRADNRLSATQVLRIGRRLGHALAHAHGQGVVHRDLKPATVLVHLATDTVKLADFGVARIDDGKSSGTGMTLGTPAYMAPELLRGHDATPASDSYALGVLLYELLTLRRPHEAATLGALLRAVSDQTPIALALLRPDMPTAGAAAIDQLLSSSAGRRPADLLAWADRLTMP